MSVRGCFRIEANGYVVALHKELEQKRLQSSRESYHAGRLSLVCHARQVASEVSARRIVLLLLQPVEPAAVKVFAETHFVPGPHFG